jgi:hypothetical protein
MPEKYLVTESCYVPVGDGRKFKKAGLIVTLSKKDADSLGGFVEPVEAKAKPAKKAAPKADDKKADDKKPEDKKADAVGATDTFSTAVASGRGEAWRGSDGG